MFKYILAPSYMILFSVYCYTLLACVQKKVCCSGPESAHAICNPRLKCFYFSKSHAENRLILVHGLLIDASLVQHKHMFNFCPPKKENCTWK